MMFPLYKDSAAGASAVAKWNKPIALNTGLWFTRFYSGFKDGSWEIDDSSKTEKDGKTRTGKQAWIDDVIACGLSGDANQINRLLCRQRALCTALNGNLIEVETQGNFVTGTGLSHPIENGFTFHPVLGMPYLPASSVKGLLRGWVEVWMPHASEAAKRALIARWFGTSKGGDQDDKSSSSADKESAGSYVFFDALPSQPVRLACDVMTPHMGKWYEKGDAYTAAQEATTAPADWHSPVPVPFLVVKSGASFNFMVAPRLTGDNNTDAHIRAELPRVLQELKNALEWLGAGAKTAAGYGRMVDVQAREAEQRATNLAQAGIAVGEETWEATLSWEKGPSKLQIKPSDSSKKAFSVAGPEGKKHFDALPEASRKKLNNGKTITAKVQVEIKGNQCKLLGIHLT